ncbi:MAG: DinB family protein [Myxococcota bacterium]
MDPLAHHCFTMACNNAWSNHRLLAACAQLTDEEFTAQRTSFFPSIKATLNHILTVDWFYLDALERAFNNQPPNPDSRRYFEPEEPFHTLAPLSVEQHACDRRLIALCRARTHADLHHEVTVTWRVGPRVEDATRVLAHLFQHQIHHRGQVHAMLAGTRVPPPQLDEFFCANDAPLRAQELAELGLTEEAVWPPTHG